VSHKLETMSDARILCVNPLHQTSGLLWFVRNAYFFRDGDLPNEIPQSDSFFLMSTPFGRDAWLGGEVGKYVLSIEQM
jgi:hypothetical protein